MGESKVTAMSHFGDQHKPLDLVTAVPQTIELVFAMRMLAFVPVVLAGSAMPCHVRVAWSKTLGASAAGSSSRSSGHDHGPTIGAVAKVGVNKSKSKSKYLR